MRACLLVSCFLALFLPFARLPLFCFGVGLKLDKLRGSLARLRRLRPDTFTLSAAVVFCAAGVLLISVAVPLPTKTLTVGTLFLLAVSERVTVRETEGIYIALSLFCALGAFFLAVCLTARLSEGFAAFFCVLVAFAAWEQKNSLAAVFLFYTLKRKRTMSPSCMTYSFPSERIMPFSLAVVIEPPSEIKSS